MNKKAAFKYTVEIVIILFAFVILAAILYKQFPAVRELVDKTLTEGIIAKFGKEAKEQPEETKPEEVTELVDSLIDAFSNKGSAPCLVVYKWKDDISLKKWKIRINKLTDGMEIYIYDPKNRANLEFTSELFPCIVAGKEDDRIPALNFCSNHLENRNCRLTGDGKEYKEFNQITFTESEAIVADGREFIIEDNKLKNEKKESINLIYKIDSEHFCFFATNDVRNANENGIDDNYIASLYQGKYNLKLCGE